MPWDKFIEGKIAISFKSEDEYNEFMQECENKGLLWRCGELPTDYDTHYSINPCIIGLKFLNSNDGLSCGDVDCFENKSYEVISYAKFKGIDSKDFNSSIFDYLEKGVI